MNELNPLQRFLDAQQASYTKALAEIRGGKKQSHWMWYIFPQLQGLGYSETAKRFAIRNKAEAEAYLAHPLLGARLVGICEALLGLESRDAHAVFGSPDDLKLRSSMTLFSSLSITQPVFEAVLDKFFAGKPDDKTLSLLDLPATRR